MLDTAKIEKLRAEREWSQEEAAKRCGLPSRAYYNDIVKGRRGNITLDLLDQIAKGFGVSPKELVK